MNDSNQNKKSSPDMNDNASSSFQLKKTLVERLLNFGFLKNGEENNSNNLKNQNPQNNSKSSKDSLVSSEKEEAFEGRTRRRRSAVTS